MFTVTAITTARSHCGWLSQSRHHTATLLAVCAMILLGGCSIQPVPLLDHDIEVIASFDRELIFQKQEEIEGELSLELAIALALKYNLESRVKLLEEAVASQQLGISETELLPELAVTAGYSDRDNLNASRSVSVSTGQESLEPSTSQPQQQSNGGARYAWNLLDFGSSYLQAKQDADRYLIARKTRERVMLKLMNEVRIAYWQAVAMEQMRDELDEVSERVDAQLDYWQAVSDERLRPPVAVLMDIRALLETQQQLDEIRRSIDTGSARLANLINARDFRELKFPKHPVFPTLPPLTTDIEALERVALVNSADYASEIYQVRIDQTESRRAMLQLLPGLEFSYGKNYNDNEYMLNSRWGEFGLNLTGDLTKLMYRKRIKKFQETKELLTVSRKLAINMAVITGVHITWQDYQNARTQLERAEHLKEIDGLISLLTDNARANQAESGAVSIQNELRAFRSNIQQAQAYADLQRAYGAFVSSMGINPVPTNYQSLTAAQLADEISGGFDREVFPFTARGERMLAERKKLDEWAMTAAALEIGQPQETILLSTQAPQVVELIGMFEPERLRTPSPYVQRMEQLSLPDSYESVAAVDLAATIATGYEREIFPFTAEGQKIRSEKQSLEALVLRANAAEDKQAASVQIHQTVASNAREQDDALNHAGLTDPEHLCSAEQINCLIASDMTPATH